MALTAAALVTRPFAAVGATVRLTGSMLFGARGGGWQVWTFRSKIDYRAEVGDPANNSIVAAVVGWLARNFPEAPVRIIQEDDPEAPPIMRSATGPGAMLRLLERPNAHFSGVLQWMATIVDFVCRGNAYWLKVRNGSGRVVELWWIPERMLEPKWPHDDPSVFIGWYEYQIDGVRYAIDPEDVIHFRYGLDSMNVRKGLSPMAALFREIFTDEEAASFTASLLRNLGVPGVVIAPANTTGGGIGKALEADPEAVKRKFMDKFGGESRGEPLVLSTPTDVKVLSFNPQQMELKQLRRVPEERVSAVTGVPAVVAGLGAGLDRSTFTNMGEARGQAYQEGVIPLQRLIAAELEIQLLPEFVGPDELALLDVIFDASKTAAMQAMLAAIWARASLDARSGLMTRASYKRMTGQKPAEDGSDDVYIIANNMNIIAAADGGKTPPVRVLLGAPKPAIGPGQTPAQPKPSQQALEDETVPLLLSETATITSGPVRCRSCRKLLAEQATAPYRFSCSRCHAVTEAEAAPLVGAGTGA